MKHHLMIAAAMLGAMAATSPASASNLTFLTTVTDTDVASFGLGYLRENGTGTLNVAGLSGSVTQAYLYWHGPTNSGVATANAGVSFGGSSIFGTNIGFSQDNFWGFANSQAYRADVTGIISAGGNGGYALSNFNKTDAEINGLSLIVFYDDGNTTNNSDVVLFNGNDANFNNAFDADGWNANLNGIAYAGGPASLTLHVSDGQNFSNDDDGTLLINGSPFATGGLFQGDGVQFGNGTSPSNGALWDVENYDISGLLTLGNNNVRLSLPGQSDALSLVVVQFNLPVGAAPPMPGVPEPSTWAMLISGFGLVGAALRGRRRAAVTA